MPYYAIAKPHTVNTVSPLIECKSMSSDTETTFLHGGSLDGGLAAIPSAATVDYAILAIDSAAAALPGWLRSVNGDRCRLLMRAAHSLEVRSQELIDSMVSEVGVSPVWAKFNVDLASRLITEAAVLSRQNETSVVPKDNYSNLNNVDRQGNGVFLAIAQKNVPDLLGVRALAVPIACGNTVVLKGSEICPATHHLLIESLQGAGFPTGVINFVAHAREERVPVMAAMIGHPAVLGMNFTGARYVGCHIAKEILQNPAVSRIEACHSWHPHNP